MNQANTLCLVAYTYLMGHIAYVLCFGLNTYNFGGWGPTMIMVSGPLVGYALGRIWTRQ
jgi:hypothetical protein